MTKNATSSDYFNPVFSDPYNIALFLIDGVVNNVVGSCLLYLLWTFIEDNKFATLAEKLLSLLLKLLSICLWPSGKKRTSPRLKQHAGKKG